MRRAIPILTALVLVATTAQSLGDGPRFSIAQAPYAFSFPRDHAAHPQYKTEWWYLTGHLRGPDGRRFGYELTFFRFGLRSGDPPAPAGRSRWLRNQIYAAHFAITDVRDGRFTYSERAVRGALDMGAAAGDRLAVRVDAWSLAGTPMRDPRFEKMHAHAAANWGALDLDLVSKKPPAVHGSGGVLRKGACDSCASHYYSYTRLPTRGALTYGGTRFAVDGDSWMDHEFGTDELPDQVGWLWFGIQLDDGRELMLYQFRPRDRGAPSARIGSLIERDGLVRPLAFSILPSGTWRSPHTGAVYPALWRIGLPSLGLDLALSPALRDQELVASSGGISYWEGTVDVTDFDQNHRQGEAYVELTGYAGPVSF